MKLNLNFAVFCPGKPLTGPDAGELAGFKVWMGNSSMDAVDLTFGWESLLKWNDASV